MGPRVVLILEARSLHRSGWRSLTSPWPAALDPGTDRGLHLTGASMAVHVYANNRQGEVLGFIVYPQAGGGQTMSA